LPTIVNLLIPLTGINYPKFSFHHISIIATHI